MSHQRIYAILNRALGLEGLTRAQAEKIIGLPIPLTMLYKGGDFAFGNHRNQLITIKYPTDYGFHSL